MSTASANKAASWNAGHVIADKFRLVRELGRGGMGAVWEAEHLALGSSVAIKLIEPHAAESTIGVVRFVREAKASAALRSPHVVQTLDHGIDGSTPYIVMEMLEGESLDERLTRKGRLSNEETARVVTHISRALTKAAEHGIVHRDLKPANIFVVDNLDDEVVKVLDFGIAKQSITEQQGSSVETKTGTLVGTPLYMSPEQTRGKTLDYRSDLWSLTMIAYECHVGSRPFDGAALGELILQICTLPLPVPSEHAEVAAGFDAWFAKAASRDIEQRYQSATELAGALRAVLLADGVGDPITFNTGERPLVQPAESAQLQTEAGLGNTIGTAKTSRSGGWLVLVGAAILVAGGYFWWTGTRAPELSEEASTPAASANGEATGKTEDARITVRPAAARVTVDGKPAVLDDGELVLHGPLGSVHQVAVVHGELEGDFRVVLTELGPQPDRIVLDASIHHATESSAKPADSAAHPTAPAHTAARPAATPTAAPPTAAPPPRGTAAPPPPDRPAQPTPPPDGPAMKPTFE